MIIDNLPSSNAMLLEECGRAYEFGMEDPEKPSASAISVITRHSPDCPKKDDRYCKTCGGRKALHMYEGGHDRIVSAKTCSWKTAVEVGQTERVMRDPVRIRLHRIEEVEAEREEAKKAKNITVAEAQDRWIFSRKGIRAGTKKVHATFAEKWQRGLLSMPYRSMDGLKDEPTLGFEDPNSFGRAFRIWEGMPPSDWRETHRISAAN